jgi:hypothetical protein
MYQLHNHLNPRLNNKKDTCLRRIVFSSLSNYYIYVNVTAYLLFVCLKQGWVGESEYQDFSILTHPSIFLSGIETEKPPHTFRRLSFNSDLRVSGVFLIFGKRRKHSARSNTKHRIQFHFLFHIFQYFHSMTNHCMAIETPVYQRAPCDPLKKSE